MVIETRFFPSYSFSCWTTYSSIGSVMYTTYDYRNVRKDNYLIMTKKVTSKPRFLRRSTKEDVDTTSLDSPVM